MQALCTGGDEPNRDRDSPFAVPPGADLVATIDIGERAGRPVHRLGDICVPRLERVAVPDRRGGYRLAQPTDAVRPGRAALPRRELVIALAMDTRETASLLLENERAVDQARALTAAAYRDVWGLPWWVIDPSSHDHHPDVPSVASLLGYGSRDAARPPVRRSRPWWAQLNAWPWWVLAAGGYWPKEGQLPDEWWTIADVVANLAAWRDPDTFLAAQTAIRRPPP